MKLHNQNINIISEGLNKADIKKICEWCNDTGFMQEGMYDEVETVKCQCSYIDEQSEWELSGRDDK